MTVVRKNGSLLCLLDQSRDPKNKFYLLALGAKELSIGRQFINHIIRSLLCWCDDALFDFLKNLVSILLVVFRLCNSLSNASTWRAIALLSRLLSGAHFLQIEIIGRKYIKSQITDE